ncbi:copia protein, partial [Tanacetum coccineum]
SGGGRGVKEKDQVGAVKDIVSASVIEKLVVKEKQSSLVDTSIPPIVTSSMSESDGTLNDATPHVANEVVSPSVVEDTIDKEKLSHVVTTTELYSPLPTQVAYPVVANYARNTWGKYGLVRSMFSSPIRLFSFQFSSMEGLDAMLEYVWVQLHGVPVTDFSEDGFSAIATKLGTPLTLDSYTTDMCMQSWGRSSYARAMIELRADVE